MNNVQWAIKEAKNNITCHLYGNMSNTYELASLSKAFTALAIVILSLELDFSLDEDVSIFHREFVFKDKNHKRHPVTIKNLLCHTSGLDGHTIRFQKAGDEDIYSTALSVVQSPLVATPGKKFIYSTGGYVVLGALIEIISGLTFSEYIHKKIFKPLNMISSDASGNSLKGFKTGILGTTLVKWKGCKAFAPAGYISSSIEDMEKFLNAFINAECNSPCLAQAIKICQDINQYVETNKKGIYYGFGWFWDRENDFFFHDGCNPGFTTYMSYQRMSKSFSIWLLNCNDGSFSEVAQKRFVDYLANSLQVDEWCLSTHTCSKVLFWSEWLWIFLILSNNIQYLVLYLLIWILTNGMLCIINGKMTFSQICLWSNPVQIAIVSNSVFLCAIAVLKLYILFFL